MLHTMPMTTRERLLARVKVTEGGCWEWTGVLVRGYGQMLVSRSSTRYVHRIAYEEFVGPIPKGLTIDHLCRNRACFNPEHLEPVTMRENLLRGNTRQAANAQKTHCVRGHPLSGDNLYVTKRGSRNCRECIRLSQRRSRLKPERMAYAREYQRRLRKRRREQSE